jgi:aerobic C4-dicarboxylate transport protein
LRQYAEGRTLERFIGTKTESCRRLAASGFCVRRKRRGPLVCRVQLEGALDAANQWPAADVIDEQRPMRRFTALGRKLYVQVLVGITLGAAIGLLDPALATSFKPLRDVFIKAIRIVVTPIIFTTIVVGVAKTGDLRQIARLGVRAIVYFEVISTLALLVGLAVGNLWPVGSSINADPQAFDPKAVADFVNASPPPSFTGFLLNIVPSTFLDPFIKGETL